MSSPIWTPFVAKIMLNERFNYIYIFPIVFGFVGVICVAQPKFIFDYFVGDEYHEESTDDDNEYLAQPGSLQYTIAAVVCVIGAIFYSISFTIIRKSGGTIKYQILVFYYALIGGKPLNILKNYYFWLTVFLKFLPLLFYYIHFKVVL